MDVLREMSTKVWGMLSQGLSSWVSHMPRLLKRLYMVVTLARLIERMDCSDCIS